MYWNDYIWFITAMLFCTLFSAIASGKVHSVSYTHLTLPTIA